MFYQNKRNNGHVLFFFVLCTLCCQFLCVVFCFSSSCVPYVVSFSVLCFVFLRRVHKTKKNKTQHRETDNIGYTRQRKTKHNTETDNIGYRLVYPMLSVSLCCVLFFFVLCTLCCQFLETDNIGYTRQRKTKHNTETDNIGYTRRRKTKHNTEKLLRLFW
jgi:L-asparagine transporter-like permease